MLQFTTDFKNPDRKLRADLFASGGVGVQLEGKGGVGSEGVSVEVREALGDVRRRDSEP